MLKTNDNFQLRGLIKFNEHILKHFYIIFFVGMYEYYLLISIFLVINILLFDRSTVNRNY